jgi:hypothetical protein
MRPELAVGAKMIPLVEQLQVEVAQYGQKTIGIIEFAGDAIFVEGAQVI